MERIAIYLRLSKEDETVHDESNSITNQRELILSYIRKNKTLRKQEIVELKDDGFSGKSMNRPGMKMLLDLVRKRQVSCIIVKDLSRFSRDYLVLGQYTEQIFPFMGIRFIAINDNYDSTDCEGGIGEIDVAFKAMLYDFYSEDLSKKIRTSLKVRKEQGKFTNAYAPYGYRKCADDHNMLEIEPEGAEVVRRIYREYAEGRGYSVIARDLNRDGILSPAAYHCRRDGKKYFRSDLKNHGWFPSSVSDILHNEIYGGTHVWNKAHSPGIGKGSGVYYPKEEWKRMEHCFPALIDEEIYRRVREKTDGHSHVSSYQEKHVLVGKVFCGNCGYALLHKWEGRPGYACYNKYQSPNPAGCLKKIRDEDLEPVILALIQEKIRNRIGMEDVIREKQKRQQEQIRSAKEKLRNMEQSYEKIEADLFRVYESYREGKTERETYLEQRRTYEQMQEKLKENQDKQRQAIEALESAQEIPEGWSPDHTYLQITKLNRNIVGLLIRKILIYGDGRIEVVWNFNNENV